MVQEDETYSSDNAERDELDADPQADHVASDNHGAIDEPSEVTQENELRNGPGHRQPRADQSSGKSSSHVVIYQS